MRQRARAGEQVEHARAVDLAEDREQRLADPIGRSAGSPVPRGATSVRPPNRTRDHPHADRPRLTPGSAPRPRSPNGPHQRLGQQRVLGEPRGRGSSSTIASARSPRPLEQLRVPRKLGDAELGQPALPRADQLALAAQLEVDLGQLEAVPRSASACSRGELLGPNSRHSDACSPRPIRPRSWCSCEIP